MIAAAIGRYGVDVPFLDQWDLVKLFDLAAQGRLTAGDLFSQFNEFRQFFPHLLFVLLGRATAWDIRYELWMMFLLACLISACVYLLGRRTIQGGSIPRESGAPHDRQTAQLALFAAANLLIFSPIQYDNWLFGIQVVYFMPNACAVVAVLVAASRLAFGVRLLLCICLAMIATFSSANGIVCWMVLSHVLWWGGREQSRPRRGAGRWWFALWVAAAAACAAVYFYGWQRPAADPSMLTVARQPVQALGYLVLLAGAPLGFINRYATAMLGAMFVLLWAGLLLYIFARRRDPALIARVTPWLAIGAYAWGTGVLIMVGRLVAGMWQAMTPRYTTFMIPHLVALLYLMWIALDDWRSRDTADGAATRRSRATAVAAGLLAAVLLGAHALSAWRGLAATSRLSLAIRQGKSCLLFIDVLPQVGCLTIKMYPNPAHLREQAEKLNALGYLRPRLLRDRNIVPAQAAGRTAEQNGMEHSGTLHGAFERFESPDGKSFVASGWARAPGRGGAADAIVLTADAGDGQRTAFALVGTGRIGGSDADMWYYMDFKVRPTELRWRRHLAADELPAGAALIEAWAFDAETGQAYKLAGAHKLDGAHVSRRPNATTIDN
ncbi:MAG: hypothetical protein M3371_13035 [Acidobacteriota bacterium]|nr:hypothetical protein [Acidobacteriota bacterium]